MISFLVYPGHILQSVCRNRKYDRVSVDPGQIIEEAAKTLTGEAYLVM